MARPKGTTKPAELHYVMRSFRFPPDLWAEFEEHVPARERSAFLREALTLALRRRASRRRYRNLPAVTDPEAVCPRDDDEWLAAHAAPDERDTEEPGKMLQPGIA